MKNIMYNLSVLGLYIIFIETADTLVIRLSTHHSVIAIVPSWDAYAQGIPHCIKGNSIQSLPYDVHFSLTKTAEMKYTAVTGWSIHVLLHISFYLYTCNEIISIIISNVFLF